jgi:stage V sporulation protein SpoVS
MQPNDPCGELIGVADSSAGGMAAAAPDERRGRPDRRKRVWWSVFYGSFKPRRRQPPRRLDESRYHSLDWHSSHLLAVSIGILLLSVADAFMTVTLLAGGAIEVNPIMAAVIEQSAAVFAVVKMVLTGAGVMLLVVLARYRFMRLVRVDMAMYVLLAGYLALLSYEFWMLKDVIAPLDL